MNSKNSGKIQNMRGFTLIEIMVVVVILGILAALVVPNILGNVDTARITAARQDLKAIESALDMYRLDNYTYPTSQQGLDALVTQPADPSIRNWRQGGYLKKLPKDPWGNPYQYLYPGTQAEMDIWSMGADGQTGGEGVTADIGNWAE